MQGTRAGLSMTCWTRRITPWDIKVCLVLVWMLLMMHQPHLQQPGSWMDDEHPTIHSDAVGQPAPSNRNTEGACRQAKPDTGGCSLPRMQADRASSACVRLVTNPCLHATYAYIESGCACCMLLHCMAIFGGGSQTRHLRRATLREGGGNAGQAAGVAEVAGRVGQQHRVLRQGRTKCPVWHTSWLAPCMVRRQQSKEDHAPQCQLTAGSRCP